MVIRDHSWHEFVGIPVQFQWGQKNFRVTKEERCLVVKRFKVLGSTLASWEASGDTANQKLYLKRAGGGGLEMKREGLRAKLGRALHKKPPGNINTSIIVTGGPEMRTPTPGSSAAWRCTAGHAALAEQAANKSNLQLQNVEGCCFQALQFFEAPEKP